MLNLSFQLLKLFAESDLPATTVQKLAHATWQNGWGQDDPIAERIQAIGTQGRWPGNCLRDLLIVSQELGIAENTPSPYLVSVKTTGGAYRQVGVFLPHEQLHLAVRHHGIDAPVCLLPLGILTMAWELCFVPGATLPRSSWKREMPWPSDSMLTGCASVRTSGQVPRNRCSQLLGT